MKIVVFDVAGNPAFLFSSSKADAQINMQDSRLEGLEARLLDRTAYKDVMTLAAVPDLATLDSEVTYVSTVEEALRGGA